MAVVMEVGMAAVTMAAGDRQITISIHPRIPEHIKMETKHASGMGTNGNVILTLLFTVTNSWRHFCNRGNSKMNGQDKRAAV